MWMPSSFSMWFGGAQKLFSTTSNQPGVDWDKGFPTKYFLNTVFNSKLANGFFSDKRKLNTKQKGCHGVGERVGGCVAFATRAFATPIFVASATPIFVASATPYFRISATQTAATPKILF